MTEALSSRNMAIQKQGARTIVVDNRSYVWRIRRKPTYSQALVEAGLVVAIEDQNGGCRLAIELATARPDNWVNAPATIVTPKDVARFIRLAIDRGWIPTKPGSTFVMRSEDLV